MSVTVHKLECSKKEITLELPVENLSHFLLIQVLYAYRNDDGFLKIINMIIKAKTTA
jgi:hypothetical protein